MSSGVFFGWGSLKCKTLILYHVYNSFKNFKLYDNVHTAYIYKHFKSGTEQYFPISTANFNKYIPVVTLININQIE